MQVNRCAPRVECPAQRWLLVKAGRSSVLHAIPVSHRSLLQRASSVSATGGPCFPELPVCQTGNSEMKQGVDSGAE